MIFPKKLTIRPIISCRDFIIRTLAEPITENQPKIDMDCSICYEELHADNGFTMCGRCFGVVCLNCAVNWRHTNGKYHCPTCRLGENQDDSVTVSHALEHIKNNKNTWAMITVWQESHERDQDIALLCYAHLLGNIIATHLLNKILTTSKIDII